MPEGWDSDPPKFEADEKGMATSKASGEAIQWAAKKIPTLVGGSADLASSNNTDIEDGGDVQKGEYGGRNIRFGVREHGMGAMVNGIGLEGLRCFGGTFLTFSDYMRGAIRLSALMKLPSIWVYTHDSIGLGEDGPTHQSVEHLPALRAIPRLNVLRPADANETVLGWQFALNKTDAPTAFALSRQNVPTLDPSWVPSDAIERGAYVLRDFGDGDTPDVILIGTGSEVGLCLEAAEKLDADGVAVRVVSMPCMDTFTHADESYREEVLPAACRARVAVEAASPLGWDKWIGEEGCFLGMETFGESGPAKDVYEHFGITADHLVELAKKTREKVGGGKRRWPQGANEPLATLTSLGTSVWLDQIRRSLIEGGELQRLIDEYSLRGVTSNPAIFEKAILGSDDYDDELREMAGRGLGPREIYENIAIRDVQMAADVLRPLYDETEGYDGYVSLEVMPDLAHDADATLAQAREYWRRCDRPNVMIKIPGTEEGLTAIERAIGEGINVNVTLLFSVESYEKVAGAYILGLERRRDAGESLDVHSVASFFVSRVDSEVDKRLEAAGNTELQGKAGIVNAQAAYVRFREIFRGPRFTELFKAGAPVPGPVWALTGVNGRNYSHPMYVEGLV